MIPILGLQANQAAIMFKNNQEENSVMYVMRCSGFAISLNKEDRKEIERNGFVRGITASHPECSDIEIIFQVGKTADKDLRQLKFDWYELPRLSFQEPGWYVEGFPDYDTYIEKDIGLEKILIVVDKKQWERLLEKGYNVTRSSFDRIDVTYWEEGMEVNCD